MKIYTITCLDLEDNTVDIASTANTRKEAIRNTLTYLKMNSVRDESQLMEIEESLEKGSTYSGCDMFDLELFETTLEEEN